MMLAPSNPLPSNEPSSARASWLDAATLTVLTAGWVYLAGWTYAWRFFERFQLGLLALDISKEYFLVYGLWVVQRWALLVLPVLLGVAVLRRYRRIHPTSVWSSKAAALFITFLLFVLAYGIGSETGRAHYGLQQQNDFPVMPRVRVWLKTPLQIQMNVSSGLRLSYPKGVIGCYYSIVAWPLFFVRHQEGYRPSLRCLPSHSPKCRHYMYCRYSLVVRSRVCEKWALSSWLWC